MYARVVLDGAAITMDRHYDYRVPERLVGEVAPGSVVLVPFGRGNRARQALVTALTDNCDYADTAKDIQSVTGCPPLTDEFLGLLEFMKQRLFCTYFDIIKAMLPPGARTKLVERYCSTGEPPPDDAYGCTRALLELMEASPSGLLRKDVSANFGDDGLAALDALVRAGVAVRVTGTRGLVGDVFETVAALALDGGALDEYVLRLNKSTAKHERVIEQLRGGPMPLPELLYMCGVTRGLVSTMQRRGVVTLTRRAVRRTPYKPREGDSGAEALTGAQRAALDGLLALIKSGKPEAALLYGITGSGKTILYMALIERVLERGRAAVMLVPEIALTPQLTDRFLRRFPGDVAVLHSRLSPGERYDEWKRIKNGRARVVVGTRSAVFAPCDNVGLIILDEEQEQSYKSESAPRYHARDVAKYRCGAHDALLLLGSATPSVESFHAARTGRYHYFELPERYGRHGLPDVILADMRDRPPGSGAIGDVLAGEIEKNLQNGEQTILFLNRRGYNTFVSCRNCGSVMTCSRCSIPLTYHMINKSLMCHYCYGAQDMHAACPECGSGFIRYFGTGTQRVEEELRTLFPDARVRRMDLDTTSYKQSHDEIIAEFERGGADILLGTQMVTKGLDMPNVTLVGVLTADAMLFVDDFRAGERAFSMLTQVIGRAGRESKRGRAVIQTFWPDNPIIELASKQDYTGFFTREIRYRRSMAYPPFCEVATVTVSAEYEQRASDMLAALSDALAAEIARRGADKSIRPFPPGPAPILKINDRYRHRMLVKYTDLRAMRECMWAALDNAPRRGADISIVVDLYPVTLR